MRRMWIRGWKVEVWYEVVMRWEIDGWMDEKE